MSLFLPLISSSVPLQSIVVAIVLIYNSLAASSNLFSFNQYWAYFSVNYSHLALFASLSLFHFSISVSNMPHVSINNDMKQQKGNNKSKQPFVSLSLPSLHRCFVKNINIVGQYYDIKQAFVCYWLFILYSIVTLPVTSWWGHAICCHQQQMQCIELKKRSVAMMTNANEERKFGRHVTVQDKHKVALQSNPCKVRHISKNKAKTHQFSLFFSLTVQLIWTASMTKSSGTAVLLATTRSTCARSWGPPTPSSSLDVCWSNAVEATVAAEPITGTTAAPVRPPRRHSNYTR